MALTLEAVAAAQARGEAERLIAIANAAHDAHLPEVALAAMQALEALPSTQNDAALRTQIVHKHAQILLQYGRTHEAVPLLKRHL